MCTNYYKVMNIILNLLLYSLYLTKCLPAKFIFFGRNLEPLACVAPARKAGETRIAIF